MSRFRNESTGIVVSVADEKDARFGAGWVSADAPATDSKRGPGRPKKADTPDPADD